MVQGRVWHETLECNYTQKVVTGRDLPLSEVRDYFADRFDEKLGGEEVAFEPGEKPGELKDQGVAIVAVHHKEIAPAVRPMLVEERFRVDLGDDFPYDLVGVWDLVERDGTIADGKALKRTPRQEDADKDKFRILKVNALHVTAATHFLDAVYSVENCALDSYSAICRAHEHLDNSMALT